MFEIEEKSDWLTWLADSECQREGDYKPGTDYWCIVSVTKNEHGDARILVLKYSEDAAYHDLFLETDADDCGMNSSWFQNHMPEGIYRLHVYPSTIAPSYPDDDWDCEINVTKIGLMMRF